MLAVFANATLPIEGRFAEDDYWVINPGSQAQGSPHVGIIQRRLGGVAKKYIGYARVGNLMDDDILSRCQGGGMRRLGTGSIKVGQIDLPFFQGHRSEYSQVFLIV